MIGIRLGTPEGRRTVIVDPNTTVLNTLNAEDVVLEDAIVSLDGIKLALIDMNQTFSSLGAAENSTLNVVIKSENA